MKQHVTMVESVARWHERLAMSLEGKRPGFGLNALRITDVPARVRITTFTVILATFAAGYVIAYLSAWALPGSFNAPLGWWGWTDQGLYLKSAQAFSHLDLRDLQHWYPPLYSLSAAPFVRIMPIHSFFIVDITCFLIVLAGFLKISSKVIGLLPSALLFGGTICFPWILADNWVIPWTSTLSAAITTILLLACADERFARGGSPLPSYLAVAIFAGLLALARPLDFVIDLVLFGYVAIRSIAATWIEDRVVLTKRNLAIFAALAVGLASGPALLAVFNLKVYGSLVTPYVLGSRESGYDLATIPQKFVSLFNDSSALFLAPQQTFLHRFPWLVVTMAMIPSVLIFGSHILRLVTVIASFHVAMYLAYGDLTPHNLFVYYTIHYFKLWMPYFALIGVGGLIFLYRERSTGSAKYAAASGLGLAAILCSFGFHFTPAPICATLLGPHTIAIEPATGSETTVDFIDFSGVQSEFLSKYLIGANLVVADDRRLRRLGDIQFVKGPTATRALFLRPLTFHKLVIQLDDAFRIPDNLTAQGERYTIGLRWPL